MTFALEFSWLDAPDVAGPDRFTWVDLAVQVGGVNLDAVDLRARAVRRHFSTSLLSLTEWMIGAWPRLIEERNLPASTELARRSWTRSHDLAAGRGGGPMPSVCIHRVDDQSFRLDASDERVRPPGISLRFHADAHAEIPVACVVRELARVIEATLGRLYDHDRWLHDDLSQRWAAARDRRALAAGRLGRSTTDGLTAADLEALDVLASDPRQMAVAEALAGDLATRMTASDGLMRGLPTVADLVPASKAWRDLRVQRAHAAPWTTGWQAATELRIQLGLPKAPPAIELAPLLARTFDWPVAQQLRTIAGRSRGIDVIVVSAPGHMPCAATSAGDDRAKRFRLAKALYLALCSGDAPAGLVVDSVRAPRHSEANAFAAELLAPAAYLSQLIPADGAWEPDDVERAAVQCAVDRRVVEHQITNRALGSLAA